MVYQAVITYNLRANTYTYMQEPVSLPKCKFGPAAEEGEVKQRKRSSWKGRGLGGQPSMATI